MREIYIVLIRNAGWQRTLGRRRYTGNNTEIYLEANAQVGVDGINLTQNRA
jgi:hypothetical protein